MGLNGLTGGMKNFMGTDDSNFLLSVCFLKHGGKMLIYLQEILSVDLPNGHLYI